MYDFSVFQQLFEDEKTSVSPLEDGGAALTVENGAKDAPLTVYYHPESAYPYTVSFEGVSGYFIREVEAFDYACGLYSGELCVLNFFAGGVSRLRYAMPLEALDLETTVAGFAVSASGGRRALAGVITALVGAPSCSCRLRTWSGDADQSIILSL